MTLYSEEALAMLRLADDKMAGAADLDGPASLVFALDAVRLTLLAIAEKAQAEDVEGDGRWMRVELFGHQIAWGLVREVTRYGRRWLEVSTPEVVETLRELDASEMVNKDERVPRVFPGEEKLYHPNAVYALAELPEDRVVAAIHHHRGIATPEETASGIGPPALF